MTCLRLVYTAQQLFGVRVRLRAHVEGGGAKWGPTGVQGPAHFVVRAHSGAPETKQTLDSDKHY